MALSNWLTRDEWNACYFLGAHAAGNGAECNNLGDQLHLGIGAMVKAGHLFEGINADEDGNYEKVEQCCDGNEAVLAERIDGGFDALARAKETVAFINGSDLSIDMSWLESGIKEHENKSSSAEPEAK